MCRLTVWLLLLGLTPGLPHSVLADTMSPVITPCPQTPNCVCSLDTGRDSFIEPFSYPGNATAAKTVLRQIIEAMPRTHIERDADNYLHATFTSRVFGFVDDVEFLVDEQRQLIEVRSASRKGKYDFGVNRRRVEKLRKLFAESLPVDR